MTICVAYMRCSGDSQVDGDTWSRQSSAINRYCEANSITIDEFFRDEGVTGKMELEGRSGLSECLQYVREHSIQLVIVEDSTRLARDMIVAEVLIREFQKLGVRVISASGGIDLTEGDDSNPTAKLIRQILAAVSEFERCCIVLKLRGARQRLKAQGLRMEGRRPYGQDPDRPEEHKVLAQMIALRDQGNSPEQVTRFLNAAGTPTRYGKAWIAQGVARILQRNPRQSVAA